MTRPAIIIRRDGNSWRATKIRLDGSVLSVKHETTRGGIIRYIGSTMRQPRFA